MTRFLVIEKFTVECVMCIEKPENVYKWSKLGSATPSLI